MLYKLMLTFPLAAFAMSAAEPEKLQELRSSYQAAVTQATVPLQQTYIQKLETLMVSYVRAGRLKDALSVSDEIKKLSSGSKSILQYDLTPDGNVIMGGFTIAGNIGTLRYSLIPEQLRRAHQIPP